MNKILTSFVVLFLVSILGFSLVSAFGLGKGMFVFEDREILEKAIQEGNYEEWKILMQSKLSEEKFNEIRLKYQEREEFRNAIQEARDLGDYEKLNELKFQFGEGKGFGKKNVNFSPCSCNR